MNNIQKLFLLCCALFLFNIGMVYENIQLDLKLKEKDRTIMDLSYELHSKIPEKTCSQLGFCVGDLVELNNDALKYLNASNETYGTVKQIIKRDHELDLVIFSQGNEEWDLYSEYFLRHKNTLKNGNETLEKVTCYFKYRDYCQTSFDPKNNSMWISSIPYE